MRADQTAVVRFPGDLNLARYPEDPRDQLRAWDASDEYALRHLCESHTDLTGTVVIVGDRWGALATALGGFGLTQVSESYLTQQATKRNLAHNGVPEGDVRLLTSVDLAEHPSSIPDRIDTLIVRVPKTLALLEDQLRRLAPALHAGSVVVGTGMVTEIHTSTLDVFTRIIGPTRTSLAVRKARLIFSTPGAALPKSPPGSPRSEAARPEFPRPESPLPTAAPPEPPRPDSPLPAAAPPDSPLPNSPLPAAEPPAWPLHYNLPAGIGVMSGRPVVNHAGTFSADHLDIGTRFFLQHLPTRNDAPDIIDLGCGNGVVGVAAALLSPRARLTFLDESYPALASARATFAANLDPEAREARFLAADGLNGIPDSSADLILNNPPFHTHQATTDATAWRMFTGARRVLRRGGELWVVGNRHLGYHVKLRRIFGNCETVASNPKFVVLRAVR